MHVFGVEKMVRLYRPIFHRIELHNFGDGKAHDSSRQFRTTFSQHHKLFIHNYFYGRNGDKSDRKGMYVRAGFLFQRRLECYGRDACDNQFGERTFRFGRVRIAENFRCHTGSSIAQGASTAAGHQPSPRRQTRRSNADLIAETDRKYCADLLYVFHHFRHFGSTSKRFELYSSIFYGNRPKESLNQFKFKIP